MRQDKVESQLNGGKPELAIYKRGLGFEIGTISNRSSQGPRITSPTLTPLLYFHLL